MLVIVAGCATMSADECRVANWFEIGQRDGLSGETLDVLDDRRKDCAEVQVAVDHRIYLAGREQGLRSYCRIENAIGLGLAGKPYRGVCPAMVDDEFRQRHELGASVHALRQQINDVEDRIEHTERKQRESYRAEEAALKDVAKDEDRRRIRQDYDARRSELRDDLRALDRRLQRLRDQLRDAQRLIDSLS
jgi:hypothetical protein